jgi:hypothetical protein
MEQENKNESPRFAALLNRPDIMGVAHLGGRQIGRKLAMQRLIDEVKRMGGTVMVMSPDDDSAKKLMGNFMLDNPPVKWDFDTQVELSYETQVMIAETMPAMAFPHREGKAVFTSFPDYQEYCGKVMMWYAKTMLDKQIDEAVWGLETRERGGSQPIELLSQSLAPASDDLPVIKPKGGKFYDRFYKGRKMR